MIGLGKWECNINHMLFKGKVQIEIIDKNGEYDFKLSSGEKSAPPFKITSISEENGDTLTVQGVLNSMPNKPITAKLKFINETSCTAEINAPIIGSIKINDIHKIN